LWYSGVDPKLNFEEAILQDLLPFNCCEILVKYQLLRGGIDAVSISYDATISVF